MKLYTKSTLKAYNYIFIVERKPPPLPLPPVDQSLFSAVLGWGLRARARA